MNKPYVSIILPAHNAEEYLPRALESLFNQTEGSWEAMCIDDASNDHSWNVLSAYAAKDPRIQAYRNDKCLWAGGSRNFGMDHSTGQYIMFCDSDNWYEPMMVETMLKTLDGEKCEIAQCYSIIETADMPVKEKINIPCLGYFNPEVKWGGMFRRPHRGLNTVCWNKIIRRDFCARITFDFLRIGGMKMIYSAQNASLRPARQKLFQRRCTIIGYTKVP